MKSRKLRTVLIVIAAMIFAYAVVLFVLTQVQTSKMDDHFARAYRVMLKALHAPTSRNFLS